MYSVVAVCIYSACASAWKGVAGKFEKIGGWDVRSCWNFCRCVTQVREVFLGRLIEATGKTGC